MSNVALDIILRSNLGCELRQTIFLLLYGQHRLGLIAIFFALCHLPGDFFARITSTLAFFFLCWLRRDRWRLFARSDWAVFRAAGHSIESARYSEG